MPQTITPAVLAAANQVEHDLDALGMSTRTLLTLLRANQDTGGGGGGGTAFYGIESQSGLSTVSQASRLGWRFTVGASDLIVNTLRYFAASAYDSRVMIHRVSDGAVMAQADITDTVDAWVEASVSEVTLAAGVSYTVSGRILDVTARNVYRNPSSITYFAGITKTANVFGGTNDNLPTLTSGNVYTFVDFGFVE